MVATSARRALCAPTRSTSRSEYTSMPTWVPYATWVRSKVSCNHFAWLRSDSRQHPWQTMLLMDWRLSCRSRGKRRMLSGWHGSSPQT
eukprot:358527-Pleurochrysis_carterae.AAC.1